MQPVRLAFRAMATRFEFVLTGSDAVSLRAAGEEAIREVKRIEERFNFYSPASELSRVNRYAASKPVTCSGMMMRLLAACRDLHKETQGKFDPTIAPALSAWGLRARGDSGRVPSPEALETMQETIGLDHVTIDETDRTIRFRKPGIQLDMGGIAKGWALDEARLILEEAGVQSALLHGGTSTTVTIGTDHEGSPWKIGVEDPYETSTSPKWLIAVPLVSRALSVSGVHGKSFTDASGKEQTQFGHVINPQTGRAVSGPRLAMAVADSAAACDAWSTALLASPALRLPEHVTGTAFLKTDSGWTVTAGSLHRTWTVPSPLLTHPTSSDD